MSFQGSVYRHEGWGTIFSYLFTLFFMFIFFSLSADAFQYLGFSPFLALGVLIVSIFTSTINLPITELEGVTEITERTIISVFGINYYLPKTVFRNSTLLAINFGGSILPVIISVLLWISNPVSIIPSIVAILIASIIINWFARPVDGLGIVIPLLIPASTSFFLAVAAAIIDPQIAPIVAYTTGVMGSLIGADIMNLNKVAKLGAPIASIGGAGTFDGIFVSGVMSVMLLVVFGIV